MRRKALLWSSHGQGRVQSPTAEYNALGPASGFFSLYCISFCVVASMKVLLFLRHAKLFQPSRPFYVVYVVSFPLNVFSCLHCLTGSCLPFKALLCVFPGAGGAPGNLVELQILSWIPDLLSQVFGIGGAGGGEAEGGFWEVMRGDLDAASACRVPACCSWISWRGLVEDSPSGWSWQMQWHHF